MNNEIAVELLEARSFAPFGDIIEVQDVPTVIINRGNCKRYSDLASLDFAEQGTAGISVFCGQPYDFPLQLDYVERHPLGSQAFLPMSVDPFLVIVAPDNNDIPGRPRAFLTRSGQGVNYHRGVWHGVLTPLRREALFAVVDRVGQGDNLEEFWIDEPYFVLPPDHTIAPFQIQSST